MGAVEKVVKRNVNLITSDEHLINTLGVELGKSDFIPHIISDPTDLDELLQGDEVSDVFIVDESNPLGMGLIDICKKIESTNEELVVILVADKEDPTMKVLALELGADDFMAKPINHHELFARLKKTFKRMRLAEFYPLSKTVYKVGDVYVDTERRICMANSQEISLTKSEFMLLAHLVRNKNTSLTRDQLINEVWGYDYIGETRMVADLVKRLRKKLRDVESEVEIITLWGYGYRVDDPGRND